MIEPKYGVLQVLFSDRVFRIPHYQRFYSWGRRQRQDLFNDLVNLATQSDEQHHFMATIVCYRTPETKTIGMAQYRVYDIVDGQQRLTTLIILLKCIELAMPSSIDRGDLACILVKRDGHLILLQTNNPNERIFNRFLREGLPPAELDLETNSDKLLAGAITHCEQFVKKWASGRDLSSLLSLVLHRLGFVVHDTEDRRAVYTVFEVLNSRGLAVDWLDKSKSLLMGRAYELRTSMEVGDAEIQGLQNLWGQIYREIAREDVPGEEILRVTSTLYYGTGAGKPLSSEDALEQIRLECKSFEKPRQVSERLLDVARKLTKVQGNVFLGPVTDILHARVLAIAIMSAPGLDKEERDKLIQQWERVSFRIFGLFGKDSRTKVGDYVRLATKIVNSDLEARTFNQIAAGLRKLGNDFPIEGAVQEGLANKDCYDQSPDQCRYILWQYEEHLARQGGVGVTSDEQERERVWTQRAVDSIEHIFPQVPSGHWNGKMIPADGPEEKVALHVGRIGNLLLLPISLNQEAKTRPFVEKKTIYEKHNLRMIQEVCSETDWTLAQIEAREFRLVEWARTRWNDL